MPFSGQEGEGKRASFTIIGLGKLGGEELLYGSDLDIIFVYSHSGETTGGKAITNHEFFTRLAQRIISIMSLVTAEGYVFRVDTRLRPSGTSGPVVTSLDAFRYYHRDKAAIWERQALLKARFSAGDAIFGREVLSLAMALIFDKPLKAGDIEEIHRLRMRMERELGQESEERFDIKFGRGGLVDIEFIVQLHQLRYGRDKKGIMGSNTLKVLKALKKVGLMSEGDAHFLIETYRFYRGIENRLRIVEDRGNSEIILTDPHLSSISRGIGYHTAEEFIRAYRTKAEKVRSIYNKTVKDLKESSA